MGLALKFLDKTGGLQITEKTFADASAGVAQTAEKIFIQNTGDRAASNLSMRITQVGDNDGNSQVRIGADTATVGQPFGLASLLTPAGAGGVWGATGTYYYALTALSALGETPACAEIAVSIDVTTKKVTLSWTQVPLATGYKLYRYTSSGAPGASSLRVTLGSGATLSYTDDGSACSAGLPPTTNTTAGGSPNYGTPPTLGTVSISIGSLAIGQQWIFWVNRVIPAGTPEAGNPRTALLEFLEG